MQVVQDEVFGAVLSLLTFSTEEEVMRRANDSHFGLAGAVFTRSVVFSQSQISFSKGFHVLHASLYAMLLGAQELEHK